MLKTARKRKYALIFLATFIATFSILFGGFVVGGPVLADDNQPEPPVDPGEGIEGGQEEEEEQEEEEQEEEEQEEEEPDDDGDGIIDTAEALLDRNVRSFQDGNRVIIESERKASAKDEFKTELVAEEGLRIKYEYRSDAESVSSDVELVVQFTQLIAYTADGDPIGEPYPLEGFVFDINYDPDASDDGESLHEITATSDGGVFLVRLFAPEGFAVINGEQTPPTTLKIDIEIHNFEYSTEASKLALETMLETSTSIANITDAEDNVVGLKATIGDHSVEYTWVSTVLVEGSPGTVEVELFDYESDDEYSELKFNMLYPLGSKIIHDPKIGTPLSALSYAQGIRVSLPQLGIIAEKLKEVIPHISIANLFFGALVATLLVVSVPVLLRRKKG